jgi:germination protein M
MKWQEKVAGKTAPAWYGDAMHAQQCTPPSSARRRGWLRLLLPAAGLMLALLASCGSEQTASTTPTSTPATSSPASHGSTPTPSASQTPAGTLRLSVYFLRDGKIAAAHRTVPYTRAVAATALRELLQGPSDTEAGAGLTTALPPSTYKLIGVSIQSGTATVRLATTAQTTTATEAERQRLAQLVYTVTQFPTVKATIVTLNGKPLAPARTGPTSGQPLARADFEDLTPAIFVESPAMGDTVSAPLTIAGTANVFEATFTAEVRTREGSVLVRKTITASAGSGTRGTFQAQLPFDTAATAGELVVFDVSQETGQRADEVRIPQRFTP